jgi:hypothetical protein
MFSEVVPPPDAVPDDPDEPDLSVLLARALLAFTREFESETTLSLPVHVDGLQVLDADTIRVRELPVRSGCSKEGMAAITGVLIRGGLATTGPDPDAARGRVVGLTARGVRARERGAARIAGVEAAWRDRFGAPAVDRLRGALGAVRDAPAFADGLEPAPMCWRARPPWVAQTDRLLADPRAALPRHPLVLHRGGFPDGA